MSKGVTVMRALEAIALVLGIVGTIVVLDAIYARVTDTARDYIELRGEILDSDIKQRAETRHYYKSLEGERPLSHAEATRLQYLEESLEQKQQQALTMGEKLLEAKGG